MKKIIFLTLVSIFLFASAASASPYLVSDPCENAEYFIIRILNDTSDPADDQLVQVDAQPDLSLQVDLVNFPAGPNNIMVRAGNTWAESVEVPFQFIKEIPGVPTNMALVNVDGEVYLVCDPQPGITQYRVIVDGTDYVLDASADGSLHYLINWVENGVHSVQVFAINMWGDSNPCPFDFTRNEPVAPQNLQLIQ